MTKIKKINNYIIYLGLNDKDARKQLINKKQAMKLIATIFSGFTLSEATGCYTYDSGETELENTLKIEVIDFDCNINIKESIQKLGRIFNQESIALLTNYKKNELIKIIYK